MKRRKLNWYLVEVKLNNGTSFDIWHTLPLEGNVNTFYAALENWEARTTEFTQQSLIDYINSKRLKGMAPDFYATKHKPEFKSNNK